MGKDLRGKAERLILNIALKPVGLKPQAWLNRLFTAVTQNMKILRRLGGNMPKGKPKQDNSGKGVRKNQGRGNCKPTRKTGKGK